MAAAKTFAVERESEPASASSLTKIALSAPIANAVRKPPVSPPGVIETRRTSPDPAASTSCKAISTP